MFSFFAQSYASAPGIVGDYLRVAFYRLTLEECSAFSRISYGTFFAHPEVKIAKGVYIGSYCVIGTCSIGGRTQIASNVQILSGNRQHERDEDGRIKGAECGTFERISVGSDCWIGAATIIMADVGDGTTIGAGSIVSRAIPGNAVAVGNPARVIKSASDLQDEAYSRPG